MGSSEDVAVVELESVTDIEYESKETVTYVDHYDEYYTYEG